MMCGSDPLYQRENMNDKCYFCKKKLNYPHKSAQYGPPKSSYIYYVCDLCFEERKIWENLKPGSCCSKPSKKQCEST